LKNSNLLDLLVNKTVVIAIEKGIIKSKSIIVDSTLLRCILDIVCDYQNEFSVLNKCIVYFMQCHNV